MACGEENVREQEGDESREDVLDSAGEGEADAEGGRGEGENGAANGGGGVGGGALMGGFGGVNAEGTEERGGCGGA